VLIECEFMKTLVRPDEVLRFTRILVRRMDERTPLLGCLRAMSKHESNPALRDLEDEFASAIEHGFILSEALERHPESFDAFYVAMVKAGELNGTLDVTLEELVSVLSDQHQAKRKLTRAACYPAATFSIFAMVIAVLMAKVWIITPGLSSAFAAFGLLIVAGGTTLCLSIWWLARSSSRPDWFDACTLRLPMFGRIFRRLYAAHCVRTVGMLLNHRAPMLQALRVAQVTVGNTKISKAVVDWRECVIEGDTLTARFEALGVCAMPLHGRIESPEDPDSLPNRLVRFSRDLEAEAREALDDVAAIAFPLLITVGATVAVLLLFALFHPGR